MGYTVGEVAQWSGVTVRTLHHYEQVALLSPAGRSPSGYRSYDDADLERLQQILFYRELGFSLDQIAAVLASPKDALEHLAYQHELLLDRIRHLQGLVAATERAMEDKRMGTTPTPAERFAALTGVTVEYQENLRARYGNTEHWQKGQRSFTDEEMAAAMTARRGWVARLQQAMDRGSSPDSDEGMAIAEDLRQSGLRYFGYDDVHDWNIATCDEYASNPQSLGHVVMPDEQRDGMGAFLRDAARANARRAGADVS